MTRSTRTFAFIASIAIALAWAHPGEAQSSGQTSAHDAVSTASPDFHADAEVDPLAYVLEGYSLHVGVGYRRLRVDLGAYAMALPSFVQPNEGFGASFDGFGVKVQYFVFGEQKGGFVGIDGGLTRVLIEDRRSDAAARQNQLGVGMHLGWRFLLGKGFYATPWIGVGYAFNARDVHLGGRAYESSSFTLFPALHLGYRFR